MRGGCPQSVAFGEDGEPPEGEQAEAVHSELAVQGKAAGQHPWPQAHARRPAGARESCVAGKGQA